jgi:uncharacterized membrane protein
MFGSLIGNGYDPYLVTGQDILYYIQSGEFQLNVPYTNAWDFRAYDYPSLAILFFSGIISIYSNDLGGIFFFTKLVLTIFDFLTALVLYRIITDQTKWGKQYAYRIAIIYLFNPISVFQVSLEGQFETVSTFFASLGIYFTLASINSYNSFSQKSRYYAYLSGIFIGFGFLTKYYPLLLLPLLWIFLQKKDLILRNIIGLIFTVFYFSVPFIFTSGYISNFIEFQSVRNDTSGLSFEVNTLGYQIGFNILIFLVFVGFAAISFFSNHKQGVIINLSTYVIFLFILTGNSLFPWYLIMVFAALPIARIESFEYSNCISWAIVILFYQIIWYPNTDHIAITVLICIIGIISSFIFFSSYALTKGSTPTFSNSKRSSLLFSVYSWLENHSKLEILLIMLSVMGILAPFTGLTHDINVWISVAEERVIHHTNPYETGLTIDEYYAYPPPWMFVLEIAYRGAQLFNIEPNEFSYRFFIKLPLIIATGITAIIIDLYLKEKGVNEKIRVISFTMIALNPLIIIITAMWGTFDIIPALCSVLAIYYCQKNIKSANPVYALLSGISMAFSSLFKIYPIIIVPVLFLSLKKKKDMLLYFLGFVLTTIIIVLPFYFMDPEAFLYIFEYHSSRMGGGITYWNGFWLLISDNKISIEQATDIINFYSFLLTILGLGLIYLLVLFNKFEDDPLSPSLITILMYFVTFKLVLEQYVVFLVPILVMWIAVYSKSRSSIDSTKLLFYSLFTIIPIIYLTISIPITDLFNVVAVQEKGEFLKTLEFREKQQILFVLGALFSVLCFIFALFVYKEK